MVKFIVRFVGILVDLEFDFIFCNDISCGGVGCSSKGFFVVGDVWMVDVYLGYGFVVLVLWKDFVFVVGIYDVVDVELFWGGGLVDEEDVYCVWIVRIICLC